MAAAVIVQRSLSHKPLKKFVRNIFKHIPFHGALAADKRKMRRNLHRKRPAVADRDAHRELSREHWFEDSFQMINGQPFQIRVEKKQYWRIRMRDTVHHRGAFSVLPWELMDERCTFFSCDLGGTGR